MIGFLNVKTVGLWVDWPSFPSRTGSCISLQLKCKIPSSPTELKSFINVLILQVILDSLELNWLAIWIKVVHILVTKWKKDTYAEWFTLFPLALTDMCEWGKCQNLKSFWHFFSILLTHEGSHREVYRDFQPSLTSSVGLVRRVFQTTGSVHPQPTLPNC